MRLVPLSGLDAGFLALETPRAPMLVGGLSILDPTTAPKGLDVDRLRALLRQRLSRSVALRRQLASLPLDLARPYWTELDPADVDLAAHVERTELPAPGGWRELSALMAWEVSQPLDRRRPLWKMTFVDGLRLPGHPAGTLGLIGTAHHAAIDGVSGAEILGALFDDESAATRDEPAVVVAPPIEPPGVLELLSRAGRDLAAAPLGAPRVVGRSLLGLAASAWSRVTSDETPPLPFAAPKSVLNRPLAGRLGWAPAAFPLSRIKAIKTAAEASVNDVVLAVCAGALRGWLVEHGELPAAPLVAMVPVSVRGSDERAQAGNLVSAMLVSLATDEPDPRARLRRIRDAARGSKVAHQAIGARTLLASADLLPFALAGLGAQLYSRLQLAARHRPLFNVVITNVPGPTRPLRIGGAALLSHFGATPLFDGLGLILTVMSYAGAVTIGVSADQAVMSEVSPFADRLLAALEELERATA
ncbi:MAG TPA: wax ester/triacylglycerol synthase family O-acyltransferase [Thermoanaerobaculia bacterium]|nr:wax ester/triacylglycerol synthase family O-acyltransferase [Thermoanaerobaculia bacterium]